MIVEAGDERALSNGMRGFQISCAQHLNRTCGRGRRGRVFVDRYHAEPLTSPRQVRNALAYVLNNWRRHREDRGSRARIDRFSTAIGFGGWLERPTPFRRPRGYEALPAAWPTTWLLRTGWKRHGLIPLRLIPGPAHPALDER